VLLLLGTDAHSAAGQASAAQPVVLQPLLVRGRPKQRL
jgi:hypothetical protein